ncbi:TPA: ATPase, T2SS/T4P/T4SS family, partial [Streptococcus suis]
KSFHSNAIIDAEAQEKFRFNLVHESLNGRRGWPIVVVRKQTINKDGPNVHMFEIYINSVGASEKQIEMIHKYARNGNIILFGETGSGKTTMLRYIGNYKLPEKRNLITIPYKPPKK